MKLLTLLASVGLLLTACSAGASTSVAPAATAQRTPSPTASAPVSTAAATEATGLASPKVAAFRQYADAINRGDVTGALAVFTDDVVWERGGQCPPGACTGKPTVQREITRDVTAHHKLTLVAADTSGANPTIRLELRNDGTQRGNVERVIQFFALELKNDRISAVRVSFDLTDPVTTAFVIANVGTQR